MVIKPTMRTFKLFPYNISLLISLVALPAIGATVNAPGVPNFHQVNDHLYRGGQPGNEGWQNLAKLGVKTVVDLRLEDEHSTTQEASAVRAAGMKYINVPMHGVVSPSDEQVRKALALFDDAAAGPVFVHCRRGADRTGTVIGCYRVAHDHWQNAQALKEARSFGMSWTQVGLKHYLSGFRPFTVEAAMPAAQAATQPATAVGASN